jgi:nitrogen fixation protein NifQ
MNLTPKKIPHRGDNGVLTYLTLTGRDPAEAVVEEDGRFDQHVFASILAAAAMDGDAVADRVGLAVGELSAMIARWFPTAAEVGGAWCQDNTDAEDARAEDDEFVMVRDLLLAHRSSEGEYGRWLAAMVARRALEPNHLWEDLGLRDRSELSRLLARHFAPIATRNTNNMRWKRFFYRMLCEDDGLVMCSTPVCTQCSDFDLCFGEENGESRLAYQRRMLALAATSFPIPNGVAGQPAE